MVQGGGCANAPNKSEVVHARLPLQVKQSLDRYAQAHGMTVSSAVGELIESALSGGADMDAVKRDLDDLKERTERIAKDASLASKRAGKASQASLGLLALACWVAPDALRFLANEALLRGQMLGRILGNEEAAKNVKVPASLGRFANAQKPEDVFKMAYSEIGGKLSRDPKTALLPAFASAVRMYGLEGLGLMDKDEDDWRSCMEKDATAMDAVAKRARKERKHG